MDLAVRAGGISLATYAVIGQVAKPLIRMIAKYIDDDGKLSRAQEDFLRWLTRTLCVVIGGVLGCMPLWPAWFALSFLGCCHHCRLTLRLALLGDVADPLVAGLCAWIPDSDAASMDPTTQSQR